MKKIISIIALVLAMTMVMSVSAFAAEEFSLGEGADAVIAEKGLTVTPAADRIAVTVPATPGADYSILLVSGSALPTSESTIAYINQENAATNAVNFAVLPKLTSCTENMTLYIGSNATGETLIAIPLVYDEEQAQYVLGDVDNSGAIELVDALAIINKVVKGTEFDFDYAELAADIDGNEIIELVDALAIINKVVKGVEF